MMKRDTNSQQSWKSERGYIWALLGSAVGFANLLCFSALCYKNGGAAFLIPLFIAYIVLGIPMLILESIVGQKFQLPIISAYGKAWGTLSKTWGWLSVIGCITIGAFYMVLTGFSIAYTYFSLANLIPQDTANFFKVRFLQDSGSLTNWGSFSWEIGAATLVVALTTLFVMTRNIQKGIERVCSIFMPILLSLVGFFVVITLFLPGAMDGVYRFFTPDFSHLKDLNLWRDVFGQLFFSMSLGLGIITGYARYSNKSVNMLHAMSWVAIGDIVIAILSGTVIFACIGYMSYTTHIPFEEIVKSDSTFEMGFVIFPMVLNTMGSLKSIFGALFFGCLIFKGLTGVFSIIESAAGNIEEEFGITRKSSVICTLAISSFLSLFFCMGNGQHILGALAPMVLGINMLLSGMATIVFFFLFNPSMREEMSLQTGLRSNRKMQFMGFWMFIVLFLIFAGALQNEWKEMGQAASTIRWSWFLLALIFSTVLARLGKRKELPVRKRLYLASE